MPRAIPSRALPTRASANSFRSNSCATAFPKSFIGNSSKFCFLSLRATPLEATLPITLGGTPFGFNHHPRRSAPSRMGWSFAPSRLRQSLALRGAGLATESLTPLDCTVASLQGGWGPLADGPLATLRIGWRAASHRPRASMIDSTFKRAGGKAARLLLSRRTIDV